MSITVFAQDFEGTEQRGQADPRRRVLVSDNDRSLALGSIELLQLQAVAQKARALTER